MQDLSRNFKFAEQMQKVSFDTDIRINFRGIIHVLSEIKNKNATRKITASVEIKVLNDDSLLGLVKLDPVILRGQFLSVFAPGKKSSSFRRDIASINMDDIVILDHDIINNGLEIIDKEITSVATELRKMKILFDTDSEEVRLLSEKLVNLKEERSRMVDNLMISAKLQSITVSVNNSVE